MDADKQKKIIEDYLERAYSGAKMMHDEELKLRISRALVAFKADVYKDIFVEDIVSELI